MESASVTPDMSMARKKLFSYDTMVCDKLAKIENMFAKPKD